jgi:hypothetical protein
LKKSVLECSNEVEFTGYAFRDTAHWSQKGVKDERGHSYGNNERIPRKRFERVKTKRKGMTHQFTVLISYLSGKTGIAGAAGDRAAWLCACGYPTPLIGRSNYGISYRRYTLCPQCSRKYLVHGSLFRRTRSVEETVQNTS